MEQQIVRNGSRAVSIVGSPGSYSARVYVNCTSTLGDATLVARKFTTLKGAQKWAAKELA